MRKADFHIFPTEMLQDHMLSYLGVPKEICRVIPHCVIAESSFVERKKVIPSGLPPGTLRIVHTGNLYGYRNPHTFFNALNNVLEKNPQMQIEVLIVGNIDEKWKKDLSHYPRLKNVIQMIPSVEYKKSLVMLSEFDLAVIIEAACNPGDAVFLPTKVTDFMQEGIPIMAISPKDGVLHFLYKKGSIGYFADVIDSVSIENEIVKIYRDFQNSRLRQNKIDNDFLPEAVIKAYCEIGIN